MKSSFSNQEIEHIKNIVCDGALGDEYEGLYGLSNDSRLDPMAEFLVKQAIASIEGLRNIFSNVEGYD